MNDLTNVRLSMARACLWWIRAKTGTRHMLADITPEGIETLCCKTLKPEQRSGEPFEAAFNSGVPYKCGRCTAVYWSRRHVRETAEQSK